MSEQIAAGACGERPASPLEARSVALITPRFVLVLACQASFGFAFSSFFLLPKFLATELDASPASIGRLTAVTSLVAVGFMIWMGNLVDRHGRRPWLVLGALVMSASSIAFAFTTEMGVQIYLLRSLQALAFSMVFVAGTAMAVDLAPSQRLGEALGYSGLTWLSMNAIAPSIVEALAATGGWAWGFGCAAGGSSMCFALALWVSETRAARSVGTRPPATLVLVRQSDQLAAAAVMIFIGVAFATMFVFHQLYALELGMSEVRTFFVAYAAAAMVARLGFPGLGDRWGYKPTAAASLLLYSLSVFAMTRLADLGLGLIGAGFGLAHGVFYPTFSALAMQGVDEGGRGRVAALLQAWFNLGVAASASLLGAVAERSGYPPVFWVAGACAAAAFVVVVASPDAAPGGRGCRAASRFSAPFRRFFRSLP